MIFTILFLMLYLHILSFYPPLEKNFKFWKDLSGAIKDAVKHQIIDLVGCEDENIILSSEKAGVSADKY